MKCLDLSFTHSSLTNDTCDLSDYAWKGVQIIHHKYVLGPTCRLSPNQWIIRLTVLIFNRNLLMSHTAVTTPGTTPGTGLLLARSVAVPKVGDYSWHGTTPGPWHRPLSSRATHFDFVPCLPSSCTLSYPPWYCPTIFSWASPFFSFLALACLTSSWWYPPFLP